MLAGVDEQRTFGWDPSKAGENLVALDRPTFEVAARVFLDPRRTDDADARFDFGEERRITIGTIRGRVYTIVYTMRGAKTWIISARPAHRKERRRYG